MAFSLYQSLIELISDGSVAMLDADHEMYQSLIELISDLTVQWNRS